MVDVRTEITKNEKRIQCITKKKKNIGGRIDVLELDNVNLLERNAELHTELNTLRGRHGRDRMVVRFTTTYAISAYHH